MPIDLHFVCPRGHMLAPISSGLLVPVGDDFSALFETGDWPDVSDEEANAAVGGRLYLHAAIAREPWHGGTIIAWRAAPCRPSHGRWSTFENGQHHQTKIFRFWADAPLVIDPKWRNLRVGLNRREPV